MLLEEHYIRCFTLPSGLVYRVEKISSTYYEASTLWDMVMRFSNYYNDQLDAWIYKQRQGSCCCGMCGEVNIAGAFGGTN